MLVLGLEVLVGVFLGLDLVVGMVFSGFCHGLVSGLASWLVFGFD